MQNKKMIENRNSVIGILHRRMTLKVESAGKVAPSRKRLIMMPKKHGLEPPFFHFSSDDPL